MSDTDTDTDIQAQLEQFRIEAAEAKAEAVRARRDALFAQAGINVNEPIGALLHRAYEGDLTVEAIRVEAEKVGALTPVAPVEPPRALSVEEQTFEQARRSIAAGGIAPPAVDQPNPYVVARQAHDQALAEGAGQTKAIAVAVRTIINAANRGDQRVLRVNGEATPVGL